MGQTNIIYQETQKGPAWIWIAGWGYIAAAGVVAWRLWRSPDVPAALWIIPAFMVALIVFLFVNFTRLKITVTDQTLEVSYGWFRHRMARQAITGARALSLNFGEVWGLGVRRTRGGLDVWNVRFGPVVRVDSQGQKRPFAFSADHPDKIIAILNNKK